MAKKIFINEIHQKQFDENGYLILDFFNKNELEKLEIIENQIVNNKNEYFDEIGFHCTSVSSNAEYKKEAITLLEEVFEKKAKNILLEYKFLTGNFYIKAPKTGEISIHQNWPIIRNLEDTTLSFWCPLLDTSVENGTIYVVPKSHKKINFIETINIPAYCHNFQEEVKKHLIPINVKKGQVLIFCDSLLHWSPNNMSNEYRTIAHSIFIPKDAETVFYKKNKDENFIDVYKIDTEFFKGNSIRKFMQDENYLEKIDKIKNPNKEINYSDFLSFMNIKPESLLRKLLKKLF